MAKILTLGFNLQPQSSELFTVKNGSLKNSNCFGYDFIIADSTNHSLELYGSESEHEISRVSDRWKEELQRWFQAPKGMIFVMRPHREYFQRSNYSWLPTDNDWTSIYDVGSSDHVGEVVTEDLSIFNFLEDNSFSVGAHLRGGLNDGFTPVAKVADDIYSAFQISSGQGRILFLPIPSDPILLFELISRLKTGPSGVWTVEELKTASEALKEISDKEREIKASRSEAEQKVLEINNTLQEVIQEDIPARKAINLFEKIVGKEIPDPRDFYETIEQVERGFESEHQMREELGIPKKRIDRVMKRANDFRHAKKQGHEPQPLTEEERVDFIGIIKEVVDKYLQYLFGKSTSTE